MQIKDFIKQTVMASGSLMSTTPCRRGPGILFQKSNDNNLDLQWYILMHIWTINKVCISSQKRTIVLMNSLFKVERGGDGRGRGNDSQNHFHRLTMGGGTKHCTRTHTNDVCTLLYSVLQLGFLGKVNRYCISYR